MTGLPVYILAGGRSSRFGSDKARALIQGRPLLSHVAAMLEPVTTRITVVADRTGKYEDLGFRTIADHQPGLGPLGGLHAALGDLPAGGDWLLLCSCDALMIRPDWLHALMEACDDQHDAVAFLGNYWQPMPALYCRRSLSTVDQCLATDGRSMNRLLDRLFTKVIPRPMDWPELWQLNTPQELTEFHRRDRIEHSSHSAMVLSSMQLDEFTTAVASNSAVPASGSVAALVAAQGVGLLEMVVMLTRRGADATISSFAEQASERLQQLRVSLLKMVDDDAASYRAYQDAWRSGNGDVAVPG